MISRNIQTQPKIKLLSSVINRKSLKRLYRRTARFRFVGLSVATSVVIFLLQSQLLESIVLAQAQPQPQPNPTPSAGCVGFLCGPYATILADPGFQAGATLFTTIFLGLNFLILVAAIAIIMKVVNASREGEEYRSFVNQGVALVVALLFVNYLGDYLI